ncbi:MAG: hypothetical protein H7Z43_01040 [Clostridia bacterium]|nr:hypothetical protein [Deltaproteobacteria bacterium]
MAVENDDVDVGRIAVVGFCTAIFVYVFITVVRVLFMQLEQNESEKKVVNESPRALMTYQHEQEEKLKDIGSAMANTTREYAAKSHH